MSEQRKERVIRAEIRTSAPPELAWEAWADPQRIAQWFVDRARGEAKEGGTFTWIWDEFGLEVPYRVLAAEAPTRLVLATPEQVAPPGLVEITIASKDGETIITVVNSGFLTEGALGDDTLTFGDGTEWDDVFQGIRSGWFMTLALLKEYLEHYAGQPKHTFIVMKPCNIEGGAVLPWFTEEGRLTQWLTRAGVPGLVGETREMELLDGTPLRVRTIARTDFELSLSWPSERAVVELKTFPLGEARMLAVRCTGWEPDDARIARVRTQCEAALERLVNAASRHKEPQPVG